MTAIIAILFFTLNSTFITLRAQNIVFYGMTSAGGSNNSGGTIFLFNPSNNTEKVVWSFGKGKDGVDPQGNLVWDATNSLFYGLTETGGSSGNGAIISYNPVTDSEKVVYSFLGATTDGSNPFGDLVWNASKTLLYGMTSAGGEYFEGCIFTFNPSTGKEAMVWSFGSSVTDANTPYGNLVWDASNSLFYGMTFSGGKSTKYGTIFSFNPASGKDSAKVVWNFGTGKDAIYPRGNLVLDSTNSLFYGMASSGGNYDSGAMFSFNTSNDSEKIVWSFGSGSDGAFPYSSLLWSSSQSLFYGMTPSGGNHDNGTIFSFSPSANNESVLLNFNSKSNGATPKGNMVWDASTALFYGMTYQSGNKGVGLIFSFDPSGNTITTVWNFGGSNDGASPFGNLSAYTQIAGINPISVARGQWSVYPNPNNGKFTIQSSVISSQPSVIEINNILGAEVFSQSSNYQIIKSSNSPISINLSGQPAGIYFIRIKNLSGSLLYSGKFIVE